jgi:hypothetical protein
MLVELVALNVKIIPLYKFFSARLALNGLVLLFCILSCNANAMRINNKITLEDSIKQKFTVAKVYAPFNGFVKVIFYESARFYKINCSNKKIKSWLTILKNAQKKGTLVQVSFLNKNDDEIILVEKL